MSEHLCQTPRFFAINASVIGVGNYTGDITNACILEALMTQLTLRNVPDSIKHKLQLPSRQRGQSMNAAAVSLLQESLGLKPAQHTQRD